MIKLAGNDMRHDMHPKNQEIKNMKIKDEESIELSSKPIKKVNTIASASVSIN